MQEKLYLYFHGIHKCLSHFSATTSACALAARSSYI